MLLSEYGRVQFTGCFFNFKLQITNYKLQITNYKLQITNYELRVKSKIQNQ